MVSLETATSLPGTTSRRGTRVPRGLRTEPLTDREPRLEELLGWGKSTLEGENPLFLCSILSGGKSLKELLLGEFPPFGVFCLLLGGRVRLLMRGSLVLNGSSATTSGTQTKGMIPSRTPTSRT